MKKILVFLVMILFIITGCNDMMNTPVKKVENLLNNYQKKDDEVLKQLNDILLSDALLSVEQRDKYKELMERQYSNMTYKIKNEAMDGKTAVVEVEIEVYDYNRAITEAEDYLLSNPSEFQDEKGNVNSSKYNDYKLTKMEEINDRVSFTINFTLSKIDDEWIVDDLTEAERMKIHGLYAY